MAELKTKENKASVSKFISSVKDIQKQEDSKKLIKIFEQVTKEKPKMWGAAIIGFGKYHYNSVRSKQEGDWMLTGFSPRKNQISLYIMAGPKNYEHLLKKLGKHKISSGCCLYINKLGDVDLKTLKQLIKESYKDFKAKYK